MSVPLCMPDGTPLVLIVRTPCAECGAAGDDPEVLGWIDPVTGQLTRGPAPEGSRPCPAADGCGSVELLRLCDLADEQRVPFVRHLVYDSDGRVTARVDTAVDGVTPYTPVGEVTDCPDGEGACQDATTVVPLCDDTGAALVSLLRWVTTNCVTGEVLTRDTGVDGVTPYTPVGVVGSCERPCQPPETCPGLVGLAGPETWSVPPGTESVQVSVVCPPVTVFPCDGGTGGVQINECGTNLSWTATGTDCAPGQLCEEFGVDVPEGSAAYVSWLSPGCGEGP